MAVIAVSPAIGVRAIPEASAWDSAKRRTIGKQGIGHYLVVTNILSQHTCFVGLGNKQGGFGKLTAGGCFKFLLNDAAEADRVRR